MGSPTPYRVNSCSERAAGSAQRSGSTCQVATSSLSSSHLARGGGCTRQKACHTYFVRPASGFLFGSSSSTMWLSILIFQIYHVAFLFESSRFTMFCHIVKRPHLCPLKGRLQCKSTPARPARRLPRRERRARLLSAASPKAAPCATTRSRNGESPAESISASTAPAASWCRSSCAAGRARRSRPPDLGLMCSAGL